jgi:hypothetical protein
MVDDLMRLRQSPMRLSPETLASGYPQTQRSMKANQHRLPIVMLAITAIGVSGAIGAGAAADPPPAPNCPSSGFTERLSQYLKPDAQLPTNDTANVPVPDCNFNEWGWEAFAWATAMVKDPSSSSSVPRFLTLATPEEVLSNDPNAGASHARTLTLAARADVFHGMPGFRTGAGSIVEADGDMLVAQNGYPVYASIHMNKLYFDTAKKNLIVNDGYAHQPTDANFPLGASVFKAAWLRLGPNEEPPAGSYTTQARVPLLETKITPGLVTIEPVRGQFVAAKVALIGLHVVGRTVNHPEFVWGTFEQKLNAPETADNTFTPSATRKDSKNYTLYKANTPFSGANIAVDPPRLTLDPSTQKFTPRTNAVQENQTGGENQTDGPGNVFALNSQAQSFLAGLKSPQSIFASYNLIGTVWLAANSYNLTSNQSNAIGAVNLANSTMETFIQYPKNTPIIKVQNCFSCHNAVSFSSKSPPLAPIQPRLVALSHVLAEGTPYEVPNLISGKLPLKPFASGE